MIIEPATGTTGILMRSFNGEYYFRVYGKDGHFIDYTLLHTDLEITIVDKDAHFYHHDNHDSTLDHSPATINVANS